MTIKLGVLLACLGLLILAGCGGLKPGGGSDSTGRVSGTIKNSVTGQLITEPVEVSFGSIATTATTGHYSLNNVPVGDRTLNAVAVGYAPYSVTVEVVAGSITHNIELDPEETDLSGIVTAPSPMAIVQAPRLWDRVTQFFAPTAEAAMLAGEAPVEGAQVRAYNWFTNQLLAGPVETDKNGKFTLEGVPVGAHIYILVETMDGKRLSTVVAGVEEEGSTEVNTVTTLAAEAMGTLQGDGPIDEDLFYALQDDVYMQMVQEFGHVDFSIVDLEPGKGWIPETFGGAAANDSIIATLRDTVVGTLGPVSRAKRIISDFRSLGPAIVASLYPTLVEAELAYVDHVGPGLQLIGEKIATITEILYHLDEILDPIDSDPVELEPGETYDFDILDEYTVSVRLLDDPVYEDEDFALYLFDVVITSSEDDNLRYSGEFDLEWDGDVLTQFKWVGEATDSDLLELAGGEPAGAPLVVDVDVALNWNEAIPVPEGLHVSGLIETPVLEIGGELAIGLASFEYGPPLYDEETVELAPESIALIGGIYVPGVIDASGATLYLEAVQGVGTAVFSNVGLVGGFSMGDGAFYIDGAFEIEITNASEMPVFEESEELFVEMEATFSGTLQVADRAPVMLTVLAERKTYADGIVLHEIVYSRGDIGLEGTGRITLDDEGDIDTFEVDLEESSGAEIYLKVDFGLGGEVDGDIRVDGEPVAIFSGNVWESGMVTYQLPNGDTQFETLW